MNQIIHADCFDILKDLPDNSIDAIVTDPPYFKVKKEQWDRQWDNPQGFLDWLDLIAEQWQRILKPNGSLYCFASPKMAARVEVKLSERFNICNHLVWNKDGKSRAAMTCKEESRLFFPESERIIFCEHYGADNIAKGEAGYGAKCDELRGFVFEPLRAYLDGERRNIGASYQKCNEVIGKPVKGGGMSTHYFSDPNTLSHCQWALPTLEHYTKTTKHI